MFRFLPLVIALTLPVTASAQSATPAEVQVLSRVIDTLCANLVDDLNGCETAALLVSETAPDSADLVIFSDRRAADPQEILAVVRNVAFNGSIFGQSPMLALLDNGSLQLMAEQIGIGRTPWTNAITIAYRDGQFIVAGQTYTTYDRAVGGGFSCDMNLLTGDWTVSADRVNPENDDTIFEIDESGRLAAARILLIDWSADRALPAPCDAALTEWFNAEPY